MLSTKFKAMSVGPLWLLRSKADDQTNNSTSLSSVAIVLTEPIGDEDQRKLLENCLFALGWGKRANYFYLTTSLEKLKEQLAVHAPEGVIVFGHGAAQMMSPEFVAGQVHQYENIPLIATHQLQEMLMQPKLKTQVWADLCSLKEVVGECKVEDS